MTKYLTPTENSKQQSENTKTPPKVDYTTIADRHRTFSWRNDSHTTGMIEPLYGISTLPLAAKGVLSKGQTFKNL